MNYKSYYTARLNLLKPKIFDSRRHIACDLRSVKNNDVFDLVQNSFNNRTGSFALLLILFDVRNS